MQESSGLTLLAQIRWRHGKLAFLACALASSASVDEQASCKAGDGGIGCEGNARVPLRWRTLPYGPYPSVEYGGDVVAMKFYDAGFGLASKDDTWDLLFTHVDMVTELDKVSLPPRKKRRIANHCGFYRAAGQKCVFANHVQAVERAYGRHDTNQQRHLASFWLNNQAQGEAWKREAMKDPTSHWVVKECTAGNSEGVQIVRGGDENAINAAIGTHAVAQKFLSRPLQVWDSSKWHIRAYVLVTSWLPTRVFLYEDGSLMLSKLKHDPSHPTGADLFSRYSETVDVIHLSMLWAKLGLERSAVAKANLYSMVGELFSVELKESFGDFGQLSKDRSFDCFDLFGIDVAFAEDLVPQVLEVNAGPNIWGDHLPVLWGIKGPLVRIIAEWAKRRIEHEGLLSAAEEEAIENATFVPFVRIV